MCLLLHKKKTNKQRKTDIGQLAYFCYWTNSDLKEEDVYVLKCLCVNQIRFQFLSSKKTLALANKKGRGTIITSKTAGKSLLN